MFEAPKLSSKLFKKFITDAPDVCRPMEPNKSVKLDCKALAVDGTAGVAVADVPVAALLGLAAALASAPNC